MTAPHATLIEALELADMLEVNGLHAFDFDLFEVEEDDDIEVEITCLEGSQRHVWEFSHEELLAARFDAEADLWVLHSQGEEIRLRCLEAFVGEDDI
jgi:hypothetical protein